MTQDTAILTQEEREQRATEILASLTQERDDEIRSFNDVVFKEEAMNRNKHLIVSVDESILNKVEDGEVSMRDLISLKTQLHKEVFAPAETSTVDLLRLIPMNATINIQNNY